MAARVCEAGGGRKTPSQCKMRWERILNPGVKKGLWTKEEDQKLKEVAAAMEYKWSHVSVQQGGHVFGLCWGLCFVGLVELSWVVFGCVDLEVGERPEDEGKGLLS